MAPSAEVDDPRMSSIKPRLKYNTIGGVNGPLVILDNVRTDPHDSDADRRLMTLCRSNSLDTTRS